MEMPFDRYGRPIEKGTMPGMVGKTFRLAHCRGLETARREKAGVKIVVLQ